MADKLKRAMRGKSARGRILRCLGILVAAVALFAATASLAVADGEGKIQNLTLTWDQTQVTSATKGVKIDGNTIDLTPQSESVNAAGTSARATVSFGVMNADGFEDIAEDQFEIRLPAYIFKNRDGANVGGFEMPNGFPTSKDETSDADNGNRLYYYQEGDEIVIKNGQPLPANYKAKFDVTWKSTTSESGPRNIAGGPMDAKGNPGDNYYTKNDIQAKSTLTQTEGTETDESETLTVNYHTFSDFTLSKKATDYQYAWDPAWGAETDKTADPDKDYIYTVWEVDVEQTGTGTEPYTMEVKDVPLSPADGVVVYNSLDPNASDPASVSWKVEPTDNTAAGMTKIVYVVRYLKPEGDELNKAFEAQNHAEATMTFVDGGSKTLKVEPKYTINRLGFKYPGSGPGIEKTSYETKREGAINAINDAEVGGQSNTIKNFRYTNSGSMRGGALTLDPTADEKSATLADYGKVPYSVELTDDLLILGGERLNDDDYCISEITTGYRHEWKLEDKNGKYEETEMASSEWCGGDDPAQTEVWIRFKGTDDYVKYGTVTYAAGNDGNMKFDLANTTFTAAPGFEGVPEKLGQSKTWWNTDQLPVRLPEGVVGAQLRWQSKNCTTKIQSTVIVNLYATEHVKTLVKDQPNIDLVNVNSLRAFYKDKDGNDCWYLPLVNNSNIDGSLAQIVSDRDTKVTENDTKPGEESATRYMFHATAMDELQSYTGHTSVYKGGRSNKASDAVADTSTTPHVAFTYNDKQKGYEGLYYLDMADWSSVDKAEAGDNTTDSQAIAAARSKKLLSEQKKGTFYDLLPAGMTVDPSSVKVWKKILEKDASDNNGTPAIGKTTQSYSWREENDEKNAAAYKAAQCESSVEFVQNWRGTGRTMMIVKVATKGDGAGDNMGALRYTNTQAYHLYCYSGFHVEYKAFYSSDSYVDYGGNFINTFAYMGDGDAKLWDGKCDDPSSIENLSDKDLMGDLNGDGLSGEGSGAPQNVVYAQADASINSGTASSASSNKRVMDERDTDWKVDTETTPSGHYRYRLRMVAPQDLKHAVIYDYLERGVETKQYPASFKKRWLGTFAGVDASQARVRGIEPKIYYATSENLNLYTSKETEPDAGTSRDLNATDANGKKVWTLSTEYTGDLADVTAIAVDLGYDAAGNEVTIDEGKTISIYVDMNAPTDPVLCKKYHDEGWRAVNRWIMSSDNKLTGSDVYTHRITPIEPVTVKITADLADFSFTKVDGSGNALEGAEFKLFKWVGSGQAPAGKKTIDAKDPGSDWKLVDGGDVTSDGKGAVAFANLAKGTYRLVEVKAPSGYELPCGQWQVKVNPGASVGVGTGKQIQIEAVGEKPPAFAVADDGSLSLPNYKPFELPSSGEMGLMGLIAGALALAFVGWVLVRGGSRNA